jgi:DNA-binding CsgD family transcriptional regulator
MSTRSRTARRFREVEFLATSEFLLMAVAIGFSGAGSTVVRCGENRRLAALAFRLNRRQGNPSELVDAGLEALDWLNLGVVLTDSTGKLLLANRTAEQILAGRDGLEVTPGGAIGTANRGGSRALRAAIQQAAQEVSPSNAALVVPRSSGKRPLTLFLRSVQGTSSPPNAPCTVLLFMLDPEGQIQATEASLRQLYGLTAREACLAHLLISGKTFVECCDYLRIRASTARMHLGNVFAKTGVQRQGQLISLLLKSVGAVRMASADKIRSRAEQHADPGDLRDDRSKARAPAVLAAGLEALDSLHIGVGVMNGLSQLLFANQTAHQILAARDGLEVTAQGMLTAVKKSGFPSVSALTEQAAQSRLRESSTPVDSVLALPRPSGRRPLTLLIRALSGMEARLDPGGPAVLVFMLDPELPLPDAESGLRQVYGFTSCEARLAHLLMEGKTLDDCCEQLDIRASTARMHLASMFGKAGVQRQGPLISLLLKSVGIVRVKADERWIRESRDRVQTINQHPVAGLD